MADHKERRQGVPADAGTVTITTPTDREVVVTRDFDAPRAMVFDALTTPALLHRWYAPTGWTLAVCEIDLKVGGKWRYVLHKPNGKAVGQRGEYREIVRPSRLVNTESWEDWDAGETLVTTVLVERKGRTTFTSTVIFPSKDVRDIVLKAGMQGTADQVYGNLADLVATMQAQKGSG
jgi:uncharacterized protein YndB with AHSA1/START domain